MSTPLPPELPSFTAHRISFYREQIHRTYQEFKTRYRRVEACLRARKEPPAEEATLYHLFSTWAVTRHRIELVKNEIRYELRFQYLNLDETMLALLQNFEYLGQAHLERIWGGVNDELALQVYALEKELEPDTADCRSLQANYTYLRWFQKGLALYRIRHPNCPWSEVFVHSLTQEHFQQLARKESSRFLYDSTYPEEFWWYRLS